jgi:hypothetical protein
LVDSIVAPKYLVPEEVTVEGESRLECGDREGDGIDRSKKGTRSRIAR